MQFFFLAPLMVAYKCSATTEKTTESVTAHASQSFSTSECIGLPIV